MKAREWRILAWIIGIMIVAGGAGYGAFKISDRMGPMVATGGNEIGGRFRLMDSSDGTMSNSDFYGRWLLVTFGATHCTADACDRMLNNLSEAVKTIDPKGSNIVPMFISLDPQRDSSERLRQYALKFPAKIVAGSGSPATLDAVAKEFHAPVKRNPDPDFEYTYEMSPQIVIMNPEGHYAGTISSNADADEMRQRLMVLMHGL